MDAKNFWMRGSEVVLQSACRPVNPRWRGIHRRRTPKGAATPISMAMVPFLNGATEAPINYPLPTPIDKAEGSDGNVGTPSHDREIPGINIGASEGRGNRRFSFVNSKTEILTSPPATIQLWQQDNALMPPSATHPESGKNPPDLAGPVPLKPNTKTSGRNLLPQTPLYQTW